MAEVKIEKSFGSCHRADVSPAVTEGVPRAMNVHFTFEEALKLHFALGQALAKSAPTAATPSLATCW
jgi:hypothetical protein